VNLQRRPVLVGGFVLGAIFLTVAMVIVIGSGQLLTRSDTAVSFFDESVTGLAEGAPVLYRGVRVGHVKDIAIDLVAPDLDDRDFRVAVVYEIERARLQSRATSREDDAFLSIERLVEQGLHAKLEVESFVTGRLSLGLDIDPDVVPAFEPVPGLSVPEIPAVPAVLQRMQTQLGRVLDSIERADIERLMSSLHAVTTGLESLLSSDGLSSALEELPPLLTELRQTLAGVRSALEGAETGELIEAVTILADDVSALSSEASATLSQVREVTHPEGVTLYQVNATLRSLEAAGEAITRLAAELERDPSVLVRGKEGRE